MSALMIGVQGVLGVLFVVIGSLTVAGISLFVENFRRFGYPQWFRVMTGSLEVLGGAGLLIGLWLLWLAPLASAGLTLAMLGAVATGVRTREPVQKLLLPIVLGALLLVIVFLSWPLFLHLMARP